MRYRIRLSKLIGHKSLAWGLFLLPFVCAWKWLIWPVVACFVDAIYDTYEEED